MRGSSPRMTSETQSNRKMLYSKIAKPAFTRVQHECLGLMKSTMSMSKNISLGLLALLATAIYAPASSQQQKPNILVIMGDDIGYWNISAYNRGMMGYRTPNIDRIAKEGAIFTDLYAQQSYTAGRSAFITGQTPLRTG